jgi:hypothetical protein
MLRDFKNNYERPLQIREFSTKLGWKKLRGHRIYAKEIAAKVLDISTRAVVEREKSVCFIN